MRFGDLFSMAMRNLFKRKMRTILTVMGVVVGSAAITIMISLGVAVNMTFDAMIEDMGQRALRVRVHGPWNPGPMDTVISRDILAQINNMPDVEIATPIVNSWMSFASGRYIGGLQIMGIEPAAMAALGLEVAEGRLLDSNDELNIVYAANARQMFRSPRDQNVWFGWGQDNILPEPDIDLLQFPLRASFDQSSLLPGGGGGNTRPYMIDGVGIMAQNDDWDFNWASFMPLEQVIELERTRHRQNQGGMRGGTFVSMGGGGAMFIGGNNSSDFPLDNAFDMAVIVVNDVNNVETVAEQIRNMGFEEWSVQTDTHWINFQREQSGALQNLLAAVGFVSLLIAAIGIANTMIMAIYERTKEIGVMKVIGATVKDVRRLFLLEAAIIGALGGLVGLLLSAFGSYLLNNTEMAFFGVQQQWGDNPDAVISFIPTWLYGLAFGFSCIVGLVSGSLPARRATKISALAAIRTE